MNRAKEILLEESKSDPNFGLLTGTMPVIERAMRKYGKEVALGFGRYIATIILDRSFNTKGIENDEQLFNKYMETLNK